MPEHALEGVLVVELGRGLATAHCGKLLADLGARVILVEEEAGQPLRSDGPGRDGAAHSALFAYVAMNKESVRLSTTPEDARLLENLVANADVLLVDGESPLEALLPAIDPPQLVRVDLSPFGRSGPYANWRNSDIATWAMGGYHYLTGEKSREPLMVPGRQSEFHGAMHAAIACLAALHDQRQTGLGQRVEVSVLESVLSAHAWLTVAWTHYGTMLDRSTHDFIPCKDGWVNFMQLIMYPNLFLLIERPDLMEDERWNDIGKWVANGKELWDIVTDWAKDKTKVEIFDAAQELRIPCCPVNNAKDLVESRQLASREWWLQVEDTALGRARLPGFPYRLSETPPSVRTPAPALGQHTEGVRAEFATQPARPPLPVYGAFGRGPLEGLRVVELTSNWAGPVCGRHLGDLGADVIKVETASRPAARVTQYPKMDPQRQYYNRSGYFNQMNRNKRDLVLDLATAEGKKAFIELIEQTDVFIENNSARVMPNLGLDYDVLSQHNPRLIMVSMTAFGRTGPERDYVAFGSNIEASCGLAAVVGYDPSQVYRTNFYYADPVSGGHGAVAILAALEYRRRTGKGQFVDLSLNECGAGFFAESILHYEMTGEVQQPSGNRDPRFAPQGVYRCAGIDNWLALSVQSDAEWPALCRVIGREDLASDARLRTLAGRRQHADEVDAAISTWATGLEQYEAAWALQRAGVSAAPVLANWQLLPDPHLHEREFYRPVHHPVVGVYPFPSWPWRLSRTPAAIRRAAPLFAEHNRQILEEIGLSPEAVAGLYEKGVTADVPSV